MCVHLRQVWYSLFPALQHMAACLQLKREFSVPGSYTDKAGRGQEVKQHVKDAESSWKSWQSRDRAGNESPSPVFEDFLSDQDHLCFNGGRLGGLEHKGFRFFKGKSSILQEKALFLCLKNLWRISSPRHENNSFKSLSCYTNGRCT